GRHTRWVSDGSSDVCSSDLASQFESGITRPSHAVMQRLAEALDVPDGFFYLPVSETHEGFFRSLRRTSISHRRRARAIAHLAHEIGRASCRERGQMWGVAAG